MRCPACGTEMNKHAEKPVKAIHSEEACDFDAVLGGVISAIHCCPACGKVEAEVEPLHETS